MFFVHSTGFTYEVSTACLRYGYPLEAALLCASFGHAYFVRWLRQLHDAVRDSKYLLRQELLNHNEQAHAHVD